MRAKSLVLSITLCLTVLASGCGICDRYCERQERIYGNRHNNNPCCYPAQSYQNPCCYPAPVGGGAVQPVPATNYYCP